MPVMAFFKKLLGSLKKQSRDYQTPGTQSSHGGLSLLDADRGLRQALDIGIEAVVAQLGAPGGFF
ncbi:MAG: hypothetical protein Q9M45_02960 [Robiginitomaculum sp.]|nr:hypothetical protein [Robiginitomaculum sp.]